MAIMNKSEAISIILHVYESQQQPGERRFRRLLKAFDVLDLTIEERIDVARQLALLIHDRPAEAELVPIWEKHIARLDPEGKP